MKRIMIGRTVTIAAVIALGLTSIASAQNKGCNNATLQGTFAFTTVGSIVTPDFVAGPYAEVGAQVFDGVGSTTGTLMLSQNGNVGPGTSTGTYSVNPDCTGTFTSTVSGFTAHYFLVIDSNGDGFRAICLDTGAIITRTAKRLYSGRAI